MEHSCFRCGARVEDGVNFCPSCGAPQIRVPARPAEEAPAAAAEAGRQPGEVAPASLQHERAAVPVEDGGVRGLDWTDALPSAALGGACGAALALIPLTSLVFPVWMAATGAFAVSFYRRRRRVPWVAAGTGARLGALAGVIGFVPFAIGFAIQFLWLQRSGMLREYFSHINTANPDPAVQQRMQQFVTWLQTPQGAAVAAVCMLIFAFLGFLVLGTIGGAVWAAATGKREPQGFSR
ncbi:MAG: zinc ribbon domain-containing protein [Acidobacteria bacterium]|nr:zinc ribbon domain-containing protein [Acidobacteriota bacterium]